jgi:DNA-binding NarL/FixJ family response regulator
MLRIALADDDPEYRLLVRLALEPESDLVVSGEAASAAELLDVAATFRPDLILLDGSLPEAIGCVSRTRAIVPDVRVVITSSLPPASVAPTVAAAGAVGSLAKDVPVARLADALRELGALVDAAERVLRTQRQALPHADTSVRESRRLAQDALAGWCDDDVLAAAELLISEVVTNGVRHAQTDVDVRIAVSASHVRVEVADRSPTMPVLRTPSPHDLRGRGMRIVDDLASRWGVQQRRTGKCVWFELPRVEATER